ncbi:DUF4149 domain-containing protein [Oceanibacterium hippocampi]|uniref:TMEM205-like domain-containing protein n=1 Tax=Oceanibacterium hippocampi TaxID=745714 RepID=A0A1Y5U1R6_9PROT|nr:DUF4149 domain-containing protein [Oceanibacterium hippocampi]SLN76920.1 hypothetical protein OCH7691_04235 [Oceanibacterium hippocampi]
MSGILTLHVLASLLCALLLGGMVFFTFVVTPTVFRRLEQPARGAFLEAILPVYYRVMGLLALAAALPVWYRSEAWILFAVGIGFVVADRLLRPRIARHRPGRERGEPAATAAFRRLHGASMVLNLAQLVLVLGVFLRLAR